MLLNNLLQRLFHIIVNLIVTFVTMEKRQRDIYSIIERKLIDKIKSSLVGYLEKIIFDKDKILEVMQRYY